MRKKLVVFDCDGVLTYEKSSWKALHEYFGSKGNLYFADLYRRGAISYLDWMKIDIALMIHSHGKPLTRGEVERAASRIRARPLAKKVVEGVVKRGHTPAVVSSGIDLVVKRVCEELNIELCFYNELVFLGEELIPGGVVHVPLKDKQLVVKKLAEETGIGLENTVYVGDDEWDIDVFKLVPVSIAVEPCGTACEYATYVVRELEEILELGIL
ncbi:MAG: HAD-IB family phosphatase [Desulfurococcaceae archaeon]